MLQDMKTTKTIQNLETQIARIKTLLQRQGPMRPGSLSRQYNVCGKPGCRCKDRAQPCWKCSTPVIKQKSRKRPNRGYYYEYYLWCPKCQATYEVEEAKRFVEQPPSLF